MEEFQEAEILWPAAAGSDDDGEHADDSDNSQGSVADVGDGEAPTTTTLGSARRPKAAAPRQPAAPVEISRRKRRCRPWPAPEHYAATFGQERPDGDEEGRRRTDDVKGSTSDDGLVTVPPHVLVARRRLQVAGRTAAYSMCAGKGRTLKGRDLRDVRNLVLKMTGFIEK